MSRNAPVFVDRLDAGRRLADRLRPLAEDRPIVVGLPRGGIPVAYEVATALGAPLDVVIVRKLGVPFQPEVGMGAVGEGGVGVVDEVVVHRLGVTDKEVATARALATRELERLASRIRRVRPALELRDRVVVIVDDGLATGGTVRAAIEFVRARGARRVVVAVPVAAPDALRIVEAAADEVVTLTAPERFRSVGEHYRHFAQTADDEVVALLIAARSAHQAMLDDPEIDREVTVPAGTGALHGHLTVPEGAFGLVLVVLASEDGRHGARSRRLAAALHGVGLGTLVVDLLGGGEANRRELVSDIGLLTDRVRAAVDRLGDEPFAAPLPIGLLAVGVASAAALTVATGTVPTVEAVVTVAGRPDLAPPVLGSAAVPTLLLVDADDASVAAHREVAARLTGLHRLDLVEGPSPMLDDPDVLDGVGATVARWFVNGLSRAAARVADAPARG